MTRRLLATALFAVAMGASSLASAASMNPSGPAPWREDFGDPVLAELLRQADAKCLDVQAAIVRVTRARAMVDAAKYSGQTSLVVGGAAAAGGDRNSQTSSAARPTLQVEYEADLWSKYAQGRKAAREALSASQFDLEVVRIATGAETVRAYGDLRLAQTQVSYARERLRLAERAQDLTAERTARGTATRAETQTAVEAAAQARDAYDHAEAQARIQLDRLRTLTDDRALAVPAGPAPVAPAAPLSTEWSVDHRPDVEAAMARFHEADARRAEAVAASRPRFLLAAAFGTPDSAIASLLDVRALAWAAIATFTHDIIGAKGRKAEARAAASDADLAEIAYRKTVLTAWSEQLAAVTGAEDARRGLRHATAAATQASTALEVARTRHAAGAIDGLELTAREADFAASRQALAEAQAASLEARVGVILARGGQS